MVHRDCELDMRELDVNRFAPHHASPTYIHARGWSTAGIIINETMARRFFPDEDPIGKIIQYGNMDGDLRPLTIIGIVADTHEYGLDAPPRLGVVGMGAAGFDPTAKAGAPSRSSPSRYRSRRPRRVEHLPRVNQRSSPCHQVVVIVAR